MDPTTRYKLYIIALYSKDEGTRIQAGKLLIEDGKMVDKMARDDNFPKEVHMRAAVESTLKLIRGNACNDPDYILREVIKTMQTVFSIDLNPENVTIPVSELVKRAYGEGLFDDEKKIETIVYFAKGGEFGRASPGLQNTRGLIRSGTVDALREIVSKIEGEVRPSGILDRDTTPAEMKQRLVELGRKAADSSKKKRSGTRKAQGAKSG
jgi:hypothetical protein